jgi:hypothetical protein
MMYSTSVLSRISFATVVVSPGNELRLERYNPYTIVSTCVLHRLLILNTPS